MVPHRTIPANLLDNSLIELVQVLQSLNAGPLAWFV